MGDQLVPFQNQGGDRLALAPLLQRKTPEELEKEQEKRIEEVRECFTLLRTTICYITNVCTRTFYTRTHKHALYTQTHSRASFCMFALACTHIHAGSDKDTDALACAHTNISNCCFMVVSRHKY